LKHFFFLTFFYANYVLTLFFHPETALVGAVVLEVEMGVVVLDAR
jgi:hypothetical protein